MSKIEKPGYKYVNGEQVDDGQSIEAVVNGEKDLARVVKEEAFMNEYVIIEIPATGDENEPPSICLNVNGIAQPIFRDEPTRVRRMFVEVLARCKETKFKAQDPDMSNPLRTNNPIGKTGWTYPFTVIEDKNPKGAEWLRAVRAEPA